MACFHVANTGIFLIFAFSIALGIMKKASLLVLLSLWSVLAFGQTEEAEGDFFGCLGKSYETSSCQRDSFMLVDPYGDALLIRRSDHIPSRIFSLLVKGSRTQAKASVKVRKEPDFVIGKTLPIDVGRLLNQCHEIIHRRYPEIVPTLGEEHVWSEVARDYLKYGFWQRLGWYVSGKQQEFPTPVLRMSKLFICLACGWTNAFCPTGQEKALAERVMSYPNRSVLPHVLFEESYELNRGNLYLTFLTCENVLAGYPHHPNRDMDHLQQKLAYLRHDSAELGDNYGVWYHLFGIALYGMVREGLLSNTVAEIESFGSYFIEGPDRQEDYINRYGAVFGKRFREMILNKTWMLPLQSTDRMDYMLPNPM